MAKELRITFKDSELDVYEHIRSKSSFSSYLKDLARLDMKREELFLHGYSNIVLGESKTIVKEEPTETTVVKDISDLDISDLNI